MTYVEPVSLWPLFTLAAQLVVVFIVVLALVWLSGRRNRGRHRANRFSITVAELQWECSRIAVADLFKMCEKMWADRAHITTTITHPDGRVEEWAA